GTRPTTAAILVLVGRVPSPGAVLDLPLFTFLLFALSSHHRQNDGPQNYPCDHQQRDRNWDLDLEPEWWLSIVRVEQHFYSNKDQGNRQAGFQVTEIANRAHENEIERPQPQNGKDVGSEHNEGLGGHCKNRGDRIDGEDQISGLDQQ